MKQITQKITLLLSLLIITMSYSQNRIWEEDFEAATIPTGWTTSNPGGNGTHDWTFGSGDMPTGGDFDNNAAIFDDDAAGDTGNHDRRFLSHTAGVDLSKHTNVSLGYEYAIQVASTNGYLAVLVFDPVANSNHSFQLHDVDTGPTDALFDIEPFLTSHPNIDRSNVQISFLFDDENSGYNWGAGIGEVYFTGTPINDACADAIDITNFPYSNTQNISGTTNNDGFITPTGCGAGMNDGVWYTFTPLADADVTINITTVFDAEIGVYTGSCSTFTCVTNVDTTNLNETVTFSVAAGNSYWINVGGYSYNTDNEEEGNLDINLSIVYHAPINDLCANAIDINCGDSLTGSSLGSTGISTTNCGLYTNNLGVWYHFAPTNGGGITSFEMTNSSFDNKLAIYKGSCETLTCVANDDDSGLGTNAYIEIETLPETDYYIYVVGVTTHTGTFTLNINCTTPDNDEAAGAILVDVNQTDAGCTSPTIIWNSNGATGSEATNGTPSCGNYSGGDIWYKFEAPTSGSVKLIRPNSGDWGAMGYAVYTAPNATTPIVCSFITVVDTQGTPITNLTAESMYWLRIWEWGNNDFGSVGFCIEDIDSTATINDLAEVNFNYYPNPVNDILHITAKENITQLSIYNTLGQEVKTASPADLSAIIDMSNLSNGTYFIKVQIGTHTGTYKIIKQ